MQNPTLPLPHVDTFVSAGELDVTRLAELLRMYAPHDGVFELRRPGVFASRASRPSTELIHSIQQPALCVVAQGTKTVRLGQETYAYDASRLLVYSVALPVATQVTQASAAEPFLTLKLNLDPQRISELALKVFPHGLPRVRDNRGVYVAQTNASIVNAAARLTGLMADERDAELIAPMVIDEILIRLLRSPVGGRVAQLGQSESSVQRVAKAVEWVREHFDAPMDVETLAEMVHMGVSTFHAHFKTVTSMSPLQYQKALRLQAARRLMATSAMDAGTVSRQVGYVSASQFSREYGRFFGCTPSRDLLRLREEQR